MAKSIYDFAENMIRSNPKFKNDPRAQQVLTLIHNRDDKAGVELANQILAGANISQEDGIKQAMSFLGLNNQ